MGGDDDAPAKAEGKSKGKKEKKALPPHLELLQKNIVCAADRVHHVSSLTPANVFRPLGIDNSWDLEEFKENFQIKVVRDEQHTMEFEMIGCDPSIANALRRILIAEIPTVAIEHVFMINNTSIIQDEVLAHRLGLVPILVDPALLEYKSREEAASEKNTLVFKLDVTCTRSGDKILNERVLSGDLHWLPSGSEIPDETGTRFAAGQAHLGGPTSAPRMVHDDILLAKLRPGQCIVLEGHCTKGVGKEHAKWSPVSTAWYRLYPEIRLLKEVGKDVAEELIAAAPGLFFIDPLTKKLAVADARNHDKYLEKVRTMLSREEISQCVQFLKRKHHFIFTIESTGILTPKQLFLQAIDVLRTKAQGLIEKL